MNHARYFNPHLPLIDCDYCQLPFRPKTRRDRWCSWVCVSRHQWRQEKIKAGKLERETSD